MLPPNRKLIFFFLTFAKKKFFLQVFDFLPLPLCPLSFVLACPTLSTLCPCFIVGLMLGMLAHLPPFCDATQRETPFNTSTNADNIKHFNHLAAAQIL